MLKRNSDSSLDDHDDNDDRHNNDSSPAQHPSPAHTRRRRPHAPQRPIPHPLRGCAHCPPLAYTHHNPCRQCRIRVRQFHNDRLRWRDAVTRVSYQRNLCAARAEGAAQDLERAKAQLLAVSNGTYNTETQFMTKRQRAAVARESFLFRTLSVHAFAQELELDKAGPALELELETATRERNAAAHKLAYLTLHHPVVLHAFYTLSHWWKRSLRKAAGREARSMLRRREWRSDASERRVLLALRRRLAARSLQCFFRCWFARRTLQRLQAAARARAAARVQVCWREHLARRRLRLLRRLAVLLHKSACIRKSVALARWWHELLRQRRLEWLGCHIRKCVLHVAAMIIQRRCRFWLRVGRRSFAQRVLGKLHHCPRRLAVGSFRLHFTRWDMCRLALDLDELQSRARRILSHAEKFFGFDKRSRKYSMLYALLRAGCKPVPASYWERFRGLGEEAREGWEYQRVPEEDAHAGGWIHFTRHPENFEWHVLQRMDRRFRACQAVSDTATNMFDMHGRRLDRADHRALLRTLLRSLDPLCVHDPEMTEALARERFFAWFFPHLSLCPGCSAMIVNKLEACAACGKPRHERRTLHLNTYSTLLLGDHGAEEVDMEDKGDDGFPPAKTRRPQRGPMPQSVSQISTPAMLFVYHANFWRLSPARFGKGRESRPRSVFWDAAVRDANRWSGALLTRLGADTIGLLSLWSEERLVKVARVPRAAAEKICELMDLLREQLSKYESSRVEDVTLPQRMKGIDKQRATNATVLPGMGRAQFRSTNAY